MIIECLECIEKKVDAAFGTAYNLDNLKIRVLILCLIIAIVLECIKLLSDIDPILVHSFSESDNENPFEILTTYLNATNHNLKYLGLLGMSYVDVSFWKSEWFDGTLLGKTIGTSYDDDTIITQALENLEKAIIDVQVLKNASPQMLEALSRNYDIKNCNTMIAYWLINRMVEQDIVDVWFIETSIQILSETRKNLDDDYVETQCSLLKQGKRKEKVSCLLIINAQIALLGEVEDTILRETSVNAVYQLLKKTNSDHISPLLIQFSFWVNKKQDKNSQYVLI